MEGKYAIYNGTIYSGYDCFTDHALLIEGDRIVEIVDRQGIPDGFERIDAQGANICPGLIDLQIYGTGEDLYSAELSPESLLRIDEQLIAQGCTSYLLTLATNSIDVFKKATQVYRATQPLAGLGLHLEGPFLNAKKKGAHPEEYIITADMDLLKDLLEGQNDIVRMMTVAPELLTEPCLAYLQHSGILISAGHSAATMEQATQAFDSGIPTVTHLWNAMSPLHHRDVGLAGAAFNHKEVCASIIVDGIHVSYEAVKISKNLMGERLFLITDAVAKCNKGIYQHIFKGDHFAMPDGTLSGSSLTMLQAIKHCVKHVHLSLEESIRMATLYPARLLKRNDIGQFEKNSLANVLIFNDDYEVISVVFQGDVKSYG
ncbi:N-acetylglucosamine-6-phosphate deacetylase [Sphingobacterium sp. HJSM2_6]|uniref:N-acetylglucosamine-6-phosphate deacetylase n=1 Tax=Sphingobacterium sp. HJSM2_6 TaxID=3366264 RepID=UPI003BBEBDB1